MKAGTTANAFTTTTTLGDSKVLGMSTASINDASYGTVITDGWTNDLKVDGTTDIAVGDWLCTFSTVKIAYKCANGGTAFAVALEAYATNDSAGVIDAFLVSPRIVGTFAGAGANTDITSLGSISTMDLNGGTIDGATIGASSASSIKATTIEASSTIVSTATGDIGWSVVAGADTACNTTCTNACVMGFDATAGIVDCATATADQCLCAGGS